MEDYLLKIIVALLAVLTGIVSWNIRSYKSDHDNLKQDHTQHKLHVSENYAKKTDLNAARMETTSSLERIHERIDSLGEIVERKIDTIIGILRKP